MPTPIEATTQHNQVFAKDSWVRAWFQGDALLPGTPVASRVLTRSAILKDPPDNWADYFDSVLSPDHALQAYKLAIHMHKRYGGPKLLNITPKNMPFILSSSNTMWKGMQAVIELRKPVQSFTRTTHLTTDDYNNFFNDPENQQALNFKRRAYKSTAVLTSPFGKSITRSYRAVIIDKSQNRIENSIERRLVLKVIQDALAINFDS